ncbi:hypothetical protein H0H92_002195 [Tricholoma furcatifolium]|nr:hypothetical protein H0H92_002195 [Tricholoma furcatifolium]
MSLCKDCVSGKPVFIVLEAWLTMIMSGVIHDGEAQGKWEDINGVNCYVATPSVEYPKDKVILFLTDVFGPQLINNQLLADSFANNGFKVIVPDYLHGDPIPPTALGPGSTFDISVWFQKHGSAETRAPLDKVLAALKEQGVTGIGATGYCFGARYCFDLAFENIIQVVSTSHPSLLQVPADLEKYLAVSKAPLHINSCTIDQQFPIESQAKADEILGNGKFAPGYKRDYYDGCTHGFAVRGDLSDPKVKAGKEGAFKGTVEWFIQYL